MSRETEAAPAAPADSAKLVTRLGFATKVLDVVPDSLQAHHLVEEAHVAGGLVGVEAHKT